MRCDFSFHYGNLAGQAFVRVNLLSEGCGGALVEIYGVVRDGRCCTYAYREVASSGEVALPETSTIVYAKFSVITPGFNPKALCFGYHALTGALDFVSYGGRIPAECR